MNCTKKCVHLHHILLHLTVSPTMTLLSHVVFLLFFPLGTLVTCAEIGESTFAEFDESYFEEDRSLYRTTYHQSRRRNRGPLIIGTYGSKRKEPSENSQNYVLRSTVESRTPGSNGAASNNGGIIKWEDLTYRFAWRRRKRQTVGKSTDN